ncbi:MAG: hypothetical protein KG012_13835 [Deltaproteobacteria bacterium]|nr:hypothetical protein [Deltaproteobacteria bacterium]
MSISSWQCTATGIQLHRTPRCFGLQENGLGGFGDLEAEEGKWWSGASIDGSQKRNP